ncbi:MAG: hypothetical protein RL326_1527 [Pseudomonadota bacterium]
MSTNNSATDKDAIERAPKAAQRVLNTTTICTVTGALLFGLLVSYLAQKALTSQFIGSGTRLVDQCKQNPNHNRDACEPILEVRRPAKIMNSRETGIQESGLPFQLSED